MKIGTLDPVTLKDVPDLQNTPFVIEGEGSNALKIYFESERNRQKYLGTPMYGPESGSGATFNRVFTDTAHNPNAGLSTELCDLR